MRNLFLLTIIILSGCATTPQIYKNPFQAGQTWQGQYTCRQGLTDLTIKIDFVENWVTKFGYGDGHGMGGNFEFKHRRTEGKFTVKGAFFTNTNEAVLNGDQWIKKPSGYKTVILSGDISERGKVFSGNVEGPGCSTFRLRLVN